MHNFYSIVTKQLPIVCIYISFGSWRAICIVRANEQNQKWYFVIDFSECTERTTENRTNKQFQNIETS